MKRFLILFLISIQGLFANEIAWDKLQDSFPQQRYLVNTSLLTLGASGMIQGSNILTNSQTDHTAKALARSLVALSFIRFSWSTYNLFTESDLEVYLDTDFKTDPEPRKTAMALSFRNSARSNRLWAAGLGVLTTANYFSLYAINQEKYKRSLISGIVGTTLLFFNFYYKTAQERYIPLDLSNAQVMHGDRLTDQVRLAYTTGF